MNTPSHSNDHIPHDTFLVIIRALRTEAVQLTIHHLGPNRILDFPSQVNPPEAELPHIFDYSTFPINLNPIDLWYCPRAVAHFMSSVSSVSYLFHVPSQQT